MTTTHQERGFVGRFDRAWSKIRRAEVACGMLWTVLVAVCGIGLVAALDFRWELAWADRLWPLSRALDCVLPVGGLSLLMVGRKPEAAGTAHETR